MACRSNPVCGLLLYGPLAKHGWYIFEGVLKKEYAIETICSPQLYIFTIFLLQKKSSRHNLG